MENFGRDALFIAENGFGHKELRSCRSSGVAGVAE
jgi:hypothetical protein